MTPTKTLLATLAICALSACQTTSGMQTPSETLYSDIDVASVSTEASAKTLSGTDPSCLTFYKNTATYLEQSAEVKKASFGGGLVKTLVLGSLAGVASGGVAAIGISSSFVEAALIGTASQMTYNTGETVYDKIIGPAQTEPAAMPTDPMVEIEQAAAVLGCPAPDKSALMAAKNEAMARAQ